MTTRDPERNRESVRRYRQRYGNAYNAGYTRARDRAAALFREMHPDKWQCLDEAMRHDERHGVWGGTSPTQRTMLRHRLAAAGRVAS